MIESLKPGQSIKCTLVKAPRAQAASKTILRLMRREVSVVRGLRRAQMLRRRNMIVYNRGNRDWYKRSIPGRIVQLETGRSWTFVYDLNIAPDLRSVQTYLKIEKA